MLKIAVFNFKGGTGKSTSALNLGAVLAQLGMKTLAIDLIRGENQNLPIDVLRNRYKPRLVLTRESDDLMSQTQQEWSAATAKMVRRNNSLPVPAKERVYPQHLISLAVELLQSAAVDWEEVKTIADLRERLK